MDNLRNPFAVHNGKIIAIDDLTPDEKGLRCNCRCPYCNGEFEAKMGERRVHHFAHTHDGCNEELAFLTGLYSIFRSYITEHGITLPPFIVFCQFGVTAEINEKNFNDFIKVKPSLSCRVPFKCSEEMPIKFDEAEIAFSRNKHPEAIIAKTKGRSLAIVVQPPRMGCNFHVVSEYKNYPTIMLDVSNISPHNFSNTEKIYEYFRKSEYSWLSNPDDAVKYIDKIQAANSLQYDVSCREKLAAAEKKQKQCELKREEAIQREQQHRRSRQLIIRAMKRYYEINNLGEPDISLTVSMNL